MLRCDVVQYIALFRHRRHRHVPEYLHKFMCPKNAGLRTFGGAIAPPAPLPPTPIPVSIGVLQPILSDGRGEI